MGFSREIATSGHSALERMLRYMTFNYGRYKRDLLPTFLLKESYKCFLSHSPTVPYSRYFSKFLSYTKPSLLQKSTRTEPSIVAVQYSVSKKRSLPEKGVYVLHSTGSTRVAQETTFFCDVTRSPSASAHAIRCKQNCCL